MKIDELKNKGLDIEWKITIPSEKISNVLNKKYEDLKKNLNLPGFRPGKVPIEVVKKRYSNTVISESMDGIINENLRIILIQKKIRPSVQPSIEVKSFEEGKDLVFNVTIQKMPDLPDIDLEKIKLEKSILNITSSDIENTLNEIATKHERFSPLSQKRSSKKGDLVLFDYTGQIAGKTFANSSGKDETVILGSNKYIPGYEDQMIGMKIDEIKDIKVTFPTDYREKNIAGKNAIFNIKIKDIQERVNKIPIDDKLARELGEENLQVLKKKIEEKMQNDFKTLSNLKMRREASENLLKKVNFDVPSKMIEQEFNFLKSQSKDKDEKELKNLTDRRVKLGIIISSVAEKNKIEIKDSDLTQAVVEEAKKYPGREKEVVEFYKKNPEMMNNLRGVALEEKVMNFIVNSCNKIEKKCTMDQLFDSDFLKDEKSMIKKEKKK